MISENLKNEIAIKNGFAEDRYLESVRSRVGKQFKLADELAILRKSVAYLFELIASLHSDEIDNAEFEEYHAAVEAIKTQIKTELGIE